MVVFFDVKGKGEDDCVLVLFSIKGVSGLNMQVINGCHHQCEAPNGG